MSSRLPSIVKPNAPSSILKNKENQGRNAAGAESLPHLSHANNSPSHQRKQKKRKKKATYEEGIRSYSRVGKLLAEFGGQNDWCSLAILRQQMAVVIQSVFRGFMVRKRWRKDPQAVVDSLHAKMEKERTAKQRRAEAIKKLEAKTITSKQKQKWGNKLAMAFGGKGATTKPGAGGGRWGKLGKNLDIARSSLDGAPLDPLSGLPDQESGSDYSDLELDNIAAIKLRAVTPPWQKTDESRWQGQFQKLQQKVNRGNLDIFWNTEETEERLQGIIERRHQRHTGGKSGEELKAEEDAPLSHAFITDLLQAKYTEKWSRLRINDPNSLQGKGSGNFSQSQGLMDPSLIKLNRTRHPSPDDDA